MFTHSHSITNRIIDFVVDSLKLHFRIILKEQRRELNEERIMLLDVKVDYH
jgi:hypothetical protein